MSSALPQGAGAPHRQVASGSPDDALASQLRDEQRVSDALEDVFSRPEFREEQSPVADAAGEFFGWLGDLFSELFPDVSEETVETGIGVFWVLLCILAGALAIWLGLSLWRQRQARRRAPANEAALRLARRVAELRERAAAAQRAGDLTLALRLYFFALVVGLGQRGELAYNDAWTNRELLERGEPGAEVARLLRPLVGELDAHSFGHRPTGTAEVARFADLCERLLGEEVAA